MIWPQGCDILQYSLWFFILFDKQILISTTIFKIISDIYNLNDDALRMLYKEHPTGTKSILDLCKIHLMMMDAQTNNFKTKQKTKRNQTKIITSVSNRKVLLLLLLLLFL